MGLSDADQRRLERQLALLGEARAHLGALAVPYLGHMRLDTGLRETDVLLGPTARTGGPLATIDWLAAPLAEVFFAHEEGEDYEVEVGDRIVAGRLLEKNLVAFEHGELVRIDFTGGALVHTARGWERVGPAAPPMPRREAALRHPFRSPLDVELDPAQQRAVDLPPDRSLLLLGEAGFGKTTVALHRLLALREKAARRFVAGVMVPTEGLRRLTRMMLDYRGVSDVEVWTFDRWAVRVGRRVFPGLPRRLSETATSRVIQLKRHPALRQVLAAFVDAHPRPLREEGAPPRGTGRASRADLEHLFGDRAWMAQVVLRSGGALPGTVVEELAEHTRVQFLEPPEIEYADVDAERRSAVDEADLHEGTPLADVNSIDVEDFAVLFELDRLRSARARTKAATVTGFDCLLVDEAQEFAPIERALLGRARKRHGTVIVAGDAAQQVDPTAFFPGWDGVMEELEASEAERAVLEVSYRCPTDVTALARAVLDPSARTDTPRASIVAARHPTLFHLAAWLSGELREVLGDDRRATAAVICRAPETARTLAKALRHGAPPHLALEGDFAFRPGLIVTCVQEVKGLEFDHVIVPDASAATYPDTPESRRALYVAITRATAKLTLACVGAPSPLL